MHHHQQFYAVSQLCCKQMIKVGKQNDIACDSTTWKVCSAEGARMSSLAVPMPAGVKGKGVQYSPIQGQRKILPERSDAAGCPTEKRLHDCTGTAPV